jgi:hypothetical protein
VGGVPCGEKQGSLWDRAERLLKLGERLAFGEFFAIASAEFALEGS